MQVTAREELKSFWWIFLITGVVNVGFGAVLLLWPDKTLAVVGWLIGLWMLFFGVIRFLIALFGGETDGRWALAFVGVAGIVLGIVVMKNPTETIGIIVLIVAIFWIIHGLIDVFRGIGNSELPARGWVIIGGALAAIAGTIILLWPEASILVLATIAGIFFIVDGVLQAVAAFKIKAV